MPSLNILSCNIKLSLSQCFLSHDVVNLINFTIRQLTASSSLCHLSPASIVRKAPRHGSVSGCGSVAATNNRLGGYNCHNIRLQGQKFFIPDVLTAQTSPQLSSRKDYGF